MYGKWPQLIVVLLLSVTFAGFNKHTSLSQTLHISNLQCFRVHTPRAQCYKTFLRHNLSLASFPSLVLCFQVRPEPTRAKPLSDDILQGRLLVLPTNIRIIWNDSSLLRKFVNCSRKKFFRVALSPQTSTTSLYTGKKFIVAKQDHKKL